MKDFVARLDKLDPQVRVVLVMVQCYSGGFANCIFNEGDAKKGVTGANRCGFYATVHNRPAAGCTPDIDEENYQEYSSSFWSAICGQTRTGQPVAPPDYDGDGRVSFAEAHAYTVLTSNTIDIPVKTSDAFLRAVSKTKDDNLQDLITSGRLVRHARAIGHAGRAFCPAGSVRGARAKRRRTNQGGPRAGCRVGRAARRRQ